MRRHVHRAMPSLTRTYPWTRCIADGDCPDARAHGNVITVEQCSCGATRLIEENGTFEVRGPWLEPDEAGETGGAA